MNMYWTNLYTERLHVYSMLINASLKESRRDTQFVRLYFLRGPNNKRAIVAAAKFFPCQET